MSIFKPILLCLPSLLLPSIALAAGARLPVPAARSADPPPGELTALALRRAALAEARAELWRDVAQGLNEPGGNLWRSLVAAWASYGEALATAQRRFLARLAASAELGRGRYDPRIRPAAFSPRVDNSYFPLVPGRTLVYEGRTSAGLERVEVSALRSTAVIDGFRCRPMRSVATLDGELSEDTTEWFAQHRSGTVWNFGELSRVFEGGFLESIEGSWRAGRDGAKAGIKMRARPRRDDAFRMEYSLEEAEDITKIIALDVTVVTARGTYHHCVQVEEWSPLEEERETKYFAPGIGLVLEVNQATGERHELVQIRN